LTQPSSEQLTEYEAWFHFDERHQAGPGLVHGGLVAAALDEACGLLATWYRFPAVTARIFVRYRQPVPINTELLVRARLVGERGRRLHVDGELTDGNNVLAEARAAFLHVPLEHFLATPEGRAAADAWRVLKSSPPEADKR
jgi:acyl-coenzyme A thioesterase PaaI-like protein